MSECAQNPCSNNPQVPNFLVVGAARAGTTSLYAYLKDHPSIFLPYKKECKYFSKMMTSKWPVDATAEVACVTHTWEEYQAYFRDVSDEKAIGDVSPDYLYYYKTSIPEIRSRLGDAVRIIILLRSPVDRTLSQYAHVYSHGCESLSFEEALQAESSRMRDNYGWPWYYADASHYYESVKAFQDAFTNVRVYLSEDFDRDPLSVMHDIFHFLGVDTSFNPQVAVRYCASHVPKNKVYASVIALLSKNNALTMIMKKMLRCFMTQQRMWEMIRAFKGKMTTNASMDRVLREQLTARFRDDVMRLESILCTDLASWRGG